MSISPKRKIQEWTLKQLQQDIANDEEWHKHYLRLPKSNRLTFRRLPSQLSSNSQRRKCLMVGKLRDKNKTAVFAQVNKHQEYDMVELRIKIGPEVEKHSLVALTPKATPEFLQNVRFFSPFNYIWNVSSVMGRAKLRYLILFYLLERHLLAKLTVGSVGSNTMKMAFKDVAIGLPKEVRPRLKLTKSSAMVSKEVKMIDAEAADEKQKVKPEQEPSSSRDLVQTSNDFPVRIVEESTFPGSVAASPSTQAVHRTAKKALEHPDITQNSRRERNGAAYSSISARERKRKRSIDNVRQQVHGDRTTLARAKPEPQSAMSTRKSPERADVVQRCKQLARDKRAQLQLKVTDLQNTLNLQTATCSETHAEVEGLKRKLKQAKKRLQAVQTVITETSSNLEEAQQEIVKLEQMEQGFESLVR